MEDDNNQNDFSRTVKYRRQEAKTVRKVVLISILSTLALLLIIGAFGYFYISSALKPLDKNNKATKQVEIPLGSSINTISALLEKEKIIKNGKVYKYYLKINNKSGFLAGVYELSPSMTLEKITEKLQSGSNVQLAKLKITIPEGKNIAEIATIIAELTKGNYEQILKELNDRDFIRSMAKKFPEVLNVDVIFGNDILYPLEGYLFPAMYSFKEEKPKLKDIVTQMLAKTRDEMAKYKTQMGETWTVHELLTMASIVEKETNNQTNRAEVMSVFKNRLDINMLLQTDASVVYALGEHRAKVTYADFAVESPYNTYKYKGLPPGPIANAGEAAIEAVLQPAETDYLYFLTDPSGVAHFAKTLEEHLINKEKYIK